MTSQLGCERCAAGGRSAASARRALPRAPIFSAGERSDDAATLSNTAITRRKSRESAERSRAPAFVGRGDKPAAVPLVPRTARTIDLAIAERHKGQFCSAMTASGSIVARRTGGVGSLRRRAGLGAVHPHMLRAGFIMAALDAGVRSESSARRPTRRPRTTTIYDRRRENFDRHASFVVEHPPV